MESKYKIKVTRHRKVTNMLLLELAMWLSQYDGEVVTFDILVGIERDMGAKLLELEKKYPRCSVPGVRSWALGQDNFPCNFMGLTGTVERAFIGVARSSGTDEYDAILVEAVRQHE